ncbi:hypothetical protein DBQ68_10500 [Lactobacillus sp. DS15_6]|nr:hypothetical protein [Lacticaseibacillus paracasei]PTS49634.1 hypothetical protein DBQ62_09765 [Lactobacillus sp. DS9_6]PTS60880.1 hypothetical protein DBQ68_10500 [Lactobacillus sp. DS15_6]PTS70103.1 hypothetical protein DBQ65_08685 [Lactobacillus sp. DS3_6]PTV39624.1 hypothetical protein DB343_10810 [Lactobacillus sp. DS18_6]
MGLSRANNTATGLVADVVRRLRDRFLGSKRRHSVPAPSGRRLRSLAQQETCSESAEHVSCCIERVFTIKLVCYV